VLQLRNGLPPQRRREDHLSDTYPHPPDGWVCFHCGERFTTVGAAGDHFGALPTAVAGCVLQVAAGDARGWLMKIRKQEIEIAQLNEALEGKLDV